MLTRDRALVPQRKLLTAMGLLTQIALVVCASEEVVTLAPTSP